MILYSPNYLPEFNLSLSILLLNVKRITSKRSMAPSVLELTFVFAV